MLECGFLSHSVLALPYCRYLKVYGKQNNSLNTNFVVSLLWVFLVGMYFLVGLGFGVILKTMAKKGEKDAAS